MFSSSCEYGLRAVIYMAAHDPGKFISIRKISEELDISFPFLTKILQTLTQAELLTSYRGPKGGIALKKRPEEITIKSIIVAIDGEALFSECVLGLPGCGQEKPCPMHTRWVEERERLDALFSSTTLAELSHGVQSLHVRLKSLR